MKAVNALELDGEKPLDHRWGRQLWFERATDDDVRPEFCQGSARGLETGRLWISWTSTGGTSKEEGFPTTSCDSKATERMRVVSCTRFAGRRLRVFTGRGNGSELRRET
jgi:hypothetical protein